MATFHYGGQALIEGVLMRGKNVLAVALRHPDGDIVWATERLDLGLRARRAMKLPFVRGLVLLYDTLVTGTRWLVRSATVQALALEEAEAAKEAEKSGKGSGGGAGSAGSAGAAGSAADPSAGAGSAGRSIGGSLLGSLLGSVVRAPIAWLLAVEPSDTPDQPAPPAISDPDAGNAAANPATPPKAEQGMGVGYNVAIGGMLILSFALGIGIFFLLPLFLAQATVGRVTQGFAFQLAEGLIRVAIFIGYLLLVARSQEVGRTFQYHGAEHMSIHALEGGDPLTPEAARKYPTAHPRCGTEFLVVVLIVSILAFALVGSLPPLWLILSRVLLIPVIAAISYEILQFGARHRNRALVRWLWSPGIWVQMITTKQPTDDMIEVAIVSLQRALVADGNAIPEGSVALASRPMYPQLAAATVEAEPAEAAR